MSHFESRGTFKTFTTLLVALLVLLWTVPASGAETSNEVEAKVENLVKQLTLDEKIKLLSGTDDEMHIPGIARLGIPELKFSDGPAGVRVWGRTTAYPCGAALAATWDVDLARELGRALGRDCRARGVHVLLGPGVNLYRVPQNGRNFEYFGEDPYLSSRMTVEWIKGCQGENVATSVKHYAANDQEILRGSINTIVDERRLHEICLPPFKAAVQEANAWTVMAAYNKLNGLWCTASSVLLTDILRKQWGFKGILMSDWGAVHDCLGPLTAGTDLEMGKKEYYTSANIKKFLKEGKVTQEQIDEHIRRILRMTVACGYMNGKQEDKSIPLNDPSSVETALKVEREGLVLLKNQKDLLPIGRTEAQNIVVLGPNACPAVTGGGGSSYTEAFSTVSLLDAITAGAGEGVNVDYIPNWIGNNPLGPTKNFTWPYFAVFEPLSDGQRGLKAQYFSNNDFSGTPTVERTDYGINCYWGEGYPTTEVKSKSYSVRWQGKIKAPQTDEYMFALSSDGARVLLDGKPIFDNWSAGVLQNTSKSLKLEAGQEHDLVVEYHHASGPATIRFTWGKANPEFTAEEKKQITNADIVIASLGFNSASESEGYDRPYDLPGEQQDLLQSVLALNEHVVVVLNAGGNVGFHHFDKVPGLIHAWFPGQNGNTAVADTIFGDNNPSGRLPDTFEKKWEDSPAFGNYPGDSANGGTVKYAEGIYVGYRWFDKKNIAPRFPFGFGLSYTTFAMNGLKVSEPTDGVVNVSVDVSNTGKSKGAEVVQLYVRPVDTQKHDRPVQELKGFKRVELAPGETKTVTLSLKSDAFSLYDEKKHAWITPEGQYEIAIGSNSRDIHCSDTITWKN